MGCRAGATPRRCASTSPSPLPLSSSGWSRRCRRSTASSIPPLLEKYGFTEDETEFFDLHITSDEVHGERGYQIVLDYADTAELQQRSLDLVRAGAEMRFSYTKSLYDTYVAPDLGPDGPASSDDADLLGLGTG